MDRISQEAWLERRPYLRPVADFHTQVALAAASIPIAGVHFPSWDSYSGDYRAGVPLLRSSRVSIDFEPAAAIVASLVENLTSKPLAEKLAEETRVLDAQLRSDLDAPRRVIAWLLGNDAFATAHPGLLRFLGWASLARYLRPLVEEFRGWRDEDRWLRCYCPTCGSSPSMSQLIGGPPAVPFLRLLRYAMAIPANWVPVLRKRGHSSARRLGDRGRGEPSYRLLRIVPRLSEDL
jgi:FdhE protein